MLSTVNVLAVCPASAVVPLNHCRVTVDDAATLDVNVTVPAPQIFVLPLAVTTGVGACCNTFIVNPLLATLLHPVAGFVTTTVYVPAWFTVIVWLFVPTFTVDVIGDPFKYHVNVAVAEGRTLDLMFKVADPHKAVDAPAVAVATTDAAGKALTVTAIALLAVTHVPCVTFTV